MILLIALAQILSVVWIVSGQSNSSREAALEAVYASVHCPKEAYKYTVFVGSNDDTLDSSNHSHPFTEVKSPNSTASLNSTASTNPPVILKNGDFLVISYDQSPDAVACSAEKAQQLIDPQSLGGQISTMVGDQDLIFTVPGPNLISDLDCPGGGCSSESDCALFYDCFFEDPWPSLASRVQLGSRSTGFQACMDTYGRPQNNLRARCPLQTVSIEEYYGASAAGSTGGCASSTQVDVKDDVDGWNAQLSDDNLAIITKGGRDTTGVWWPRPGFGTPMNVSNPIEVFMPKLIGSLVFACSLESSCAQTLQCASVGSRTAVGFAKEAIVLRSRWGLQVVTSIMNINRQLTNQYQALQGGAINAAFEAFTIKDFFPQKKDPPKFLEALKGIGTFFGAVAGFLPGVGSAAAGAAGSILPAIGSSVESSITSNADSLKEKATDSFTSQVKQVYKQLVATLDDTANRLLKGESIDGFSIFDILKGGAWLDATNLTPIKGAERQMTLEIMARGINLLWSTYSSNKRWVLFIELNDRDAQGNPIHDACMNDTSGPPSTKYCADGGVYYTYNFIEGSGSRIDWPWGGDKLSKIDPDFNVSFATEGSARLYQLAKNKTLNIDPFNPDPLAVSQAFYQTFIQARDAKSLDGMAGRYPGSWSLPVCNASTWGKKWNLNYEAKRPTSKGAIPCFCGEGGKETAAFAKAAGLENFQTYNKQCSDLFNGQSWTWPANVTEVDIGSGWTFRNYG